MTYQDYTNPDDQPSTNIDSPGSQPTTVLLRTTPNWTTNQPQTLTHLGHNQQQSFSGLHQPGRSTNHKHWLTWVTTNNSPSQDYTNPDDQPTTSIDSPGSQPTTVLLRTTPTRRINEPQILTHLGHNQQQSFSGLHQLGRSTNHKHWLTWVTTNNSPFQDYTNSDDQPTTNIDSPGSQPTRVHLRTTPTRTINQPQTLTHLGSDLSLYRANIWGFESTRGNRLFSFSVWAHFLSRAIAQKVLFGIFIYSISTCRL